MTSSSLVTVHSKKDILLNLKQSLESYAISNTQAVFNVSMIQILLRQGCVLFEKDIDKFLPIDYSSDLKISSEKAQAQDQQEKTLLILEVLKLLLNFPFSVETSSSKKFDKALALRNYFIKLMITDLGKEERDSIFALVEHERPNQPDVGILKLYNELGSHVMLEKLISNQDVARIGSCLQAFLEYFIKKNQPNNDISEHILKDIEVSVIQWMENK